MRIKVTRERMTVEFLVWQTLGRQDSMLVERTFALNPGLASLGVILPIGTEFELPEPEAERPALIETVRLWD